MMFAVYIRIDFHKKELLSAETTLLPPVDWVIHQLLHKVLNITQKISVVTSVVIGYNE